MTSRPMQLAGSRDFRRRSRPSAAFRAPRRSCTGRSRRSARPSAGSRRSWASGCSTARSANGALTEAGRLLQEYAARLLQPGRGGRSRGARAAAGPARPRASSAPTRRRCTRCCRISAASRRRIRTRWSRSAASARAQIAAELLQPQPRLRRADVPAGRSRAAVDRARRRRARDARASRASARRPHAASTIEEVGQQTVIAHNDPSPARDRVLRAVRAAPRADQHSGRAAEPRRHQARGGDGPRRRACCRGAARSTEIARGQLVAIKVPGLQRAASGAARLPARGELSHAAAAFLRSRRRALTRRRLEPPGSRLRTS